MARAALVALAYAAWASWAAAVSAARYVDYSGDKMPQYGGGEYDSGREPSHGLAAADDYHGHSPDASVSLDYKFEEDDHGDSLGKSERPSKELEDRESWSKYSRRHREHGRLRDDENINNLDNSDPELEDTSKIKLNHRMSVHRSRQKIKKNRKESPQPNLIKYTRGRSDHFYSNGDYYGSKEEIRGVNRRDVEDGLNRYRHNKVTERIIRRKPRDRRMRARLEEDREMTEDIDSNRRMKPDHRSDPDYLLHRDDRETTMINDRESYRSVMEEEDTEVGSKRKHVAYDNYGDYYDMKRVHNIKNKLPTLLRRTSARVSRPTVTSAGAPDELWTHRRAALMESSGPAVPPQGLSVVPLPPSSKATTTSTATASTSHTTKPPRVTSRNTSEEISLAEKSRLSILKKAQRKESLRHDSSTKKPPVLLQVTDKRLTVVVVEPPSSEGPWMRAREVAHDTPERVDRAKILMRRKLVARAKNIQELTDNWDEMVCDYIDVSLLDAAPPPAHPSRVLALVLMFLIT